MKIALFDLDGTLVRGYISSSFVYHLCSKNIFSKSEILKVDDLRNAYLAKNISYDELVERWAIVWARGIGGRSFSEVMDEAIDFIKNSLHMFYEEGQKLMSLMKDNGFKTYIVSSAMHEIVKPSADFLRMDGYFSTEAEVKEGFYTGKILTDIHALDGKKRTISKLLEKFEIKQVDFAFGDSIADVGMLEKARIPVAINADERLKEVARHRGWRELPMEGVLNFVKSTL